jgi:hypothetical protein
MLAAAKYSGDPDTARGEITDNTRIETALVGPVERKRDDPNSAPTIEARNTV